MTLGPLFETGTILSKLEELVYYVIKMISSSTMSYLSGDNLLSTTE